MKILQIRHIDLEIGYKELGLTGVFFTDRVPFG